MCKNLILTYSHSMGREAPPDWQSKFPRYFALMVISCCCLDNGAISNVPNNLIQSAAFVFLWAAVFVRPHRGLVALHGLYSQHQIIPSLLPFREHGRQLFVVQKFRL